MRLKQILSLALCFCCLFGAGAQDTQHERFARKIQGKRVKMSFCFQSCYNKTEMQGEGELLYLDGSFMLLLGNDAGVVNDNNKTCWTLDYINKECIVQNAYKVDIGRSPRQIFEMFGVNTKGADITTVYKKDDTLSMIAARMTNGNFMKIDVTGMEIMDSLETGCFSVDTKLLGKDWVVTDLR